MFLQEERKGMMIMSKNKGFSKFILGASIGLGVGMLFSKKNGKENREALKRKVDELIQKTREIDSKEVVENIQKQVDSIIQELKELDKEKVKSIAKKKAEQIKSLSEQLVEYAVEKGTPLIEKSANAVREKAILVTKDVLKKLEQKD